MARCDPKVCRAGRKKVENNGMYSLHEDKIGDAVQRKYPNKLSHIRHKR